MKTFTFLASFLALGAAAPQKRQIASTCEPDPTHLKGLVTPKYYVANWAQEATGGEQCSVIDAYDDSSISWHSTFSWDSSRFIRGNPNAGYRDFEKKDIGDIESIPVSWEWDFEGTDVEAAVLYNLIGSGQGCPSMMSWVMSIWLATYGDLKPNDGSGNDGQFLASTTIEGVAFDVYTVSSVTAFTYIFQATEELTSFEGDLASFVRWPAENTSTASQIRCVWQVQGGTEVWGGQDAKFTAKNYTVEQH